MFQTFSLQFLKHFLCPILWKCFKNCNLNNWNIGIKILLVGFWQVLDIATGVKLILIHTFLTFPHRETLITVHLPYPCIKFWFSWKSKGLKDLLRCKNKLGQIGTFPLCAQICSKNLKAWKKRLTLNATHKPNWIISPMQLNPSHFQDAPDELSKSELMVLLSIWREMCCGGRCSPAAWSWLMQQI